MTYSQIINWTQKWMKLDLMFSFFKLLKHLDYTIRKIIRRNNVKRMQILWVWPLVKSSMLKFILRSIFSMCCSYKWIYLTKTNISSRGWDVKPCCVLTRHIFLNFVQKLKNFVLIKIVANIINQINIVNDDINVLDLLYEVSHNC